MTLTEGAAFEAMYSQYKEQLNIVETAGRDGPKEIKENANYFIFDSKTKSLKFLLDLDHNPFTPKVDSDRCGVLIKTVHLFDVGEQKMKGLGFTFQRDPRGSTYSVGYDKAWEVKHGSVLDVILRTQVVPDSLEMMHGQICAAYDLASLFSRHTNVHEGVDFTWAAHSFLYYIKNDLNRTAHGRMMSLMIDPVHQFMQHGGDIYGIIAIGERGRDYGAVMGHELSIGPYTCSRSSGILPGKVDRIQTTSEYSKYGKDHFVEAAFWEQGLEKGQSIVICDDLMATSNTAAAFAKYVNERGATPYIITVLDLLYITDRPSLENTNKYAPFVVKEKYGPVEPSEALLQRLGLNSPREDQLGK